MHVKVILHPTDFSDSARQALMEAVRFAVAHDAALHIYHAILLHSEDPVQTDRAVNEYLQTARDEWRSLARPERTLDITISSGRDVSVFDAVMDKVDEIQPDLIVVGTHGRSGLTKFLMGSEADKLLRHAPCNVLTLRADARLGSPDGRFRRLLVPVDFSDHARRALQSARALASEAGGTIVLLHVIEPLPPLYYAGGITSRCDLDPDLAGRVQAKLREWAGDTADEVVVREGTAAGEITRLSESREVDLVVMGSRGLTGLEHFLVGSVTERVCRAAKAPVLTVRPVRLASR